MAKKFPDLTGDGKVTRADILKGRGVFKKGGSMSKYQEGGTRKTVDPYTQSLIRTQREKLIKDRKDLITDKKRKALMDSLYPKYQINPQMGGMQSRKKGGSAHPGFKAVQASIAKKQGVSKKAAGAILAASTRKASASAKRANPNLKKVKG